MDRHAYLIMAHNHFGFLKELLGCLDDSRNDIYLHIDRKAGSLITRTLIHTLLITASQQPDSGHNQAHGKCEPPESRRQDERQYDYDPCQYNQPAN